jgi:hypothetical protein
MLLDAFQKRFHLKKNQIDVFFKRFLIFWCVDVKNKIKIWKKIILMHF